MSNLDSKRASQLAQLTKLQTIVENILPDHLEEEALQIHLRNLEAIDKKHCVIISALEDEPEADFDKITDNVERFREKESVIRRQLMIHLKNLGPTVCPTQKAQGRYTTLLEAHEYNRSIIRNEGLDAGQNAIHLVFRGEKDLQFLDSQLATFESIWNREEKSLSKMKRVLSMTEPVLDRHSRITTQICLNEIDDGKRQNFHEKHQQFAERFFSLTDEIRREIEKMSPTTKSQNDFCSAKIKLSSIELPKFNQAVPDNGTQASAYNRQTEVVSNEFFPSKRTMNNSSHGHPAILLSTAIVKIQDRFGNQNEARAHGRNCLNSFAVRELAYTSDLHCSLMVAGSILYRDMGSKREFFEILVRFQICSSSDKSNSHMP